MLLFGEIIPQSVCQRHGLAIGYHTRGVVWALLLLAAPVNVPLGWLLDTFLGKEQSGLFKRVQLKALVDLHGKAGGLHGGELSADETTIISGALDLTHKTVESVMTPTEKMRCVSSATPLTFSNLQAIVACGHSRLPVHLPGEPTSIVGLLLVKELFHSVTQSDLAADESSENQRTLADAVQLRSLPRMNRDVPLYTALNFFQTGRSHMALVVKGPSVLFADNPVSAASPAAALSLSTSPSVLAAVLRRQRAVSEAALLPGSPTTVAPIILRHSAPSVPPEADDVLGILTLEDVLEELLQEEILDEDDRRDPDEQEVVGENDRTLHEHLYPPRLSGEESAHMLDGGEESAHLLDGGEEQHPTVLSPSRRGGDVEMA